MNQKKSEPQHLSVMMQQFLDFFKDRKIETFFEGTLGAGGHAAAILEAHPEIKTYVACDKDPEAIEIARDVLKDWKGKVKFVHGDFADLDDHLSRFGIKKVDGFFLI
jgi:16S rRNA (cytosine1402-N4)-methyltransferase